MLSSLNKQFITINYTKNRLFIIMLLSGEFLDLWSYLLLCYSLLCYAWRILRLAPSSDGLRGPGPTWWWPPAGLNGQGGHTHSPRGDPYHLPKRGSQGGPPQENRQGNTIAYRLLFNTDLLIGMIFYSIYVFLISDI